MRSTEFINEVGPSGRGGPGRQMTDAEYAAQQYQGEKNLQGIKNFFAGAPQTGAASNMARDPAQQAGQGRPENSMDDSDDVYATPFVKPTAPAAPAAPTAPAAVEPPAASFAGQSDEFGGVQEPAATKLPARPGQQTGGQAATPGPSRAPGIRPAILGYASSMGLYKNGKPDIAAIKAFQEKNGLTKDGIIGPDTEGAILSASPSGMTGMGRGGQGGPAAYKQNMPPINTQQAATPVPVDPTKQSVNQRLSAAFGSSAPGTSPIDQARAKMGIPAGGTSPSPMRESSFEESVDRMRRLSNMLKG